MILSNNMILHDRISAKDVAPLRMVAAGIALSVVFNYGNSDSINEREAVPEPNMVVNPSNAAPSPTDEIANTLSSSRYFWIDYKAKPEEQNNLMADARTKNLFGLSEIALNAYVVEKNATDLKIPDFSDGVSTFDFEKINNAIDGVNDPIERQVVDEYIVASITDIAVSATRFNDIEVDDAVRVLNTLESGKGDELRDELETLDAAKNAIMNYDNPTKAQQDATDITDPGIKNDLDIFISGIDAEYDTSVYFDSREAYERLQEAKGRLEETLLVDIEKSRYDARHYYVSLLSGDNVEAIFREQIKSFNNINASTEMHALPELHDPGKPIDLSSVLGVKTYQASAEQGLYEQEFGEVRAMNGKLELAIHDGSKISHEAEEQLRRLTEDALPLLESAFGNGDLISIRFVAGDYFDPYFDPTSHEVHMILPQDNSTSEEQFRQALVHEVIHALVSSVYDQKRQVTDEESLLVKNACTSLAAQSLEYFNQSMDVYPEILDNLISSAQTEQDRIIFTSLKKIIVEDEILSILQEGTGSIYEWNQKDVGVTDCGGDVVNFRTVLNAAIQDYDGLRVYDYNQKNVIIESIHARYFNVDEKIIDPNYYRLLTAWTESYNEYSLWKKLNESAYVDTKYYLKDYLGHSDDNSTELMASLGDVSLNNASEIKMMMLGLNESDRKTVYDAIDATYTIISNRHPSLSSFLQTWKKQFAALV